MSLDHAADTDLLSDPETSSEESDASESQSLSGAETVLPPLPSPSPPLSPYLPDSPPPPPSSDEPTQATPTEECLICKEEAPATEYTTLPCTFGHRYMTSCIMKWAKMQGSLSSCPMCRESLAYKRCNHKLELARLTGDKHRISRHELRVRKCWLCRDVTRYERVFQFSNGFRRGSPFWDMLRPGDLRVLEVTFPNDYGKELEETRQKHAQRIETWRQNLQRYTGFALFGSEGKGVAQDISGHIRGLQYKLDEIARVEENCNKPASVRAHNHVALNRHRGRLEEEQDRRTRIIFEPRNTSVIVAHPDLD